MARPGRVVLLGPANQLAACAPPPSTIGIQPLDSAADADRILGELSAAGVDATFILDSPDLTADLLAALPRPTLAWLDAGPAAHAWLASPAAAAVDRVIAAGHQGAGIW